MLIDQLVKTWNATTRLLELFGGIKANGDITAVGGSISGGVQVIPYVSGVPIPFNLNLGAIGIVAINNNVAFVLANPTNAKTGAIIRYTIQNTSGAPLGAGTFGTAFKATANVPVIATGFNRTISFYFNGTNWIEILPGTDIAN